MKIQDFKTLKELEPAALCGNGLKGNGLSGNGLCANGLGGNGESDFDLDIDFKSL